MVLGLAAALLIIPTGLRIEVEPRGAAPGEEKVRGSAAVLTGLGLLVVLVLALYGLWPWLARLGQFGEDTPVGLLLANTWLPSRSPPSSVLDWHCSAGSRSGRCARWAGSAKYSCSRSRPGCSSGWDR